MWQASFQADVWRQAAASYRRASAELRRAVAVGAAAGGGDDGRLMGLRDALADRADELLELPAPDLDGLAVKLAAMLDPGTQFLRDEAVADALAGLLRDVRRLAEASAAKGGRP